MKENKHFIIIFALLFVIYNFLVFFVGGFSVHGSAFWTSYVFELFSCAAIVVSLCILMRSETSAKVFFWGIR